ncbi:hypothetical protein TVAG_418700 [Trichomonas vaginalis G3]|uniref:Uncharacterized protein n=1 Tax=Trichomonas vaginalis (strain ATCC PRA-98 / G3) TaxID=412133 RepID=A2E7E0_TRIV3|nr:hypothetical protein TVAGG3_0831970 [Trichomonas vaginalis G3]EAY11433.1 hypothetical protein TVAG_418700 [Trichomonas vaginalis G3]KAI5498645.1 hypothetical protein TVAGG3_0831970 [Trichomonas vaginalis G3]|eukprot:XP_001323656.1 hypothetical protein [Trichomonas vaginalis G3]
MDFLLSDNPKEMLSPGKKSQHTLTIKVISGENPKSSLNKNIFIRLMKGDELISDVSQSLTCTTSFSQFYHTFKVPIENINDQNNDYCIDICTLENNETNVIASTNQFSLNTQEILNSFQYTTINRDLYEPSTNNVVGQLTLRIKSKEIDNCIKFSNSNLSENSKVIINRIPLSDDTKNEYNFMSEECFKLCSQESAENLFGTSSDDEKDDNNSFASFSSSMLSPMHTPIRDIDSILDEDHKTERSIDIFFERKIISGFGRTRTEPYFDIAIDQPSPTKLLTTRSLSQEELSPRAEVYSPIKKSPSIDSLLAQGSTSLFNQINLSTDSEDEKELSFVN